MNKSNKSGTEDLAYKILESAIKRSFAGYTIHFRNKMRNDIIVNNLLPEPKEKTNEQILQEYNDLIDKTYDIIVRSLLDFIDTSERCYDVSYKSENKPTLVDIENKMNIFLKNIKFEQDDIRALLRRRGGKKELNTLRYLQLPMMEILKTAKQYLKEIVYPTEKKKITTNGIAGSDQNSAKYRLIRESLRDKAIRDKLIEENKNANEGVKK
jgi:hypothetical protein